MVSKSLILAWMLHLLPNSIHKTSFQSTAQAIADAANEDPNPLDAASLLTAIARYESNFEIDAVSKPSDSTKSFGLFQISKQWMIMPASAYQQAVIALHLIRASQKRCGNLDEYTSGRCEFGKKAALDREKLAKKLFYTELDIVRRKRPVTDKGTRMVGSASRVE